MTSKLSTRKPPAMGITSAAAIALLAAIVMGGVTSPANAGVKKGSDWYFRGSTYRDKAVKKRADPVNLLWLGGGKATLADVGTHLAEDWPSRTVFGLGGMKATPAVCHTGQYMRWRHLPGGDVDKNDISLSTSNICRKQFHFRGWDDYEHWKGTGYLGHPRNSWVVGGIHHENFKLKGGHKPDRAWDVVRFQAVKNMKRHCSYARWRFHPGAARDYQEIPNSGYIARISMRHTSEGCSGA
jgi:hypothetical protein